jgi:hypothetical protein
MDAVVDVMLLRGMMCVEARWAVDDWSLN